MVIAPPFWDDPTCCCCSQGKCQIGAALSHWERARVNAGLFVEENSGVPWQSNLLGMNTIQVFIIFPWFHICYGRFKNRTFGCSFHGASDGSECTGSDLDDQSCRLEVVINFQYATSSYQHEMSASWVSRTSSYLHSSIQSYSDDSWEPRVLKIRLAATLPQGATYVWLIKQWLHPF